MVTTREAQALRCFATSRTFSFAELCRRVLLAAYLMRHYMSPARQPQLTEDADTAWIIGTGTYVSVSKSSVAKMLATMLAAHCWIEFTSCFMATLLCSVPLFSAAKLTAIQVGVVPANSHVTLAFQRCSEDCAAMLAVALRTHSFMALELVAGAPRPLARLGHEGAAAVSALKA
mmetsp:Transcript_50688/g.94987  ORF Transcript_50688/g.94987 Transcript_50688/m.94987 type:complete len:174 (-) Transcript_50688:503-1024(-)